MTSTATSPDHALTAAGTAPAETRWVSTAEMARVAGCCARTLMRWVQRGVIPPPARMGASCLRWPLDAVLAALEAARTITPDATAPGTAEAAEHTP
jgi:predicted DNA-binding transcriptional regulator AlpA